ncbi:hypothetical protein ARMSODRAFT_1027004 [Armillaria solidipes]|uniref:CxC2-like cysteine cluster KDZ transposase-associated domain-containing protein n=1 Tax=Armillaria solidipes TaxID=1076256 RepID=A0A2H3BAC3_9AGAR|nr:hypothetical protein ARMSODRAFT_1027004 [Armillaria solidipes]
MHCRVPIAGHVSFKVLHMTGIHDITVNYCGCERQLLPHVQLLQHEFLHLLSLCSKVSVYDFYQTLEKTSANTGMGVSKSRIKMLMHMKLQWAHLKMLKRGGRVHIDSGVARTAPGGLAVLCPSCPCPGINLSDGWENAPLEFQFLYTLIICMDANFHLKNQIVSSFSCDPGLGIGWVYFVLKPAYDAYVLDHMSDEDISTCIGFVALAKADTKFSQGLCFMGNLQKGERYAPIDFVFASTLQNFVMLLLGVISYGIACQWFINLYERMNGWPSNLRINRPLKLRLVIPKFHEPAHKVEKHHEFSCNLVKGLGNYDCEGPERIWGGHNNLGNSTKTMGPGSHYDVLNDHFSFWNWQKYIGMGKSLIHKYKAAVEECNMQVKGHRGLSANLPAHLVAQWDSLCEVWEDDTFPKTVENPFHVDRECYVHAVAPRSTPTSNKDSTSTPIASELRGLWPLTITLLHLISHFRFILLFHILILEPESGSEQTSVGFHRTLTRITYSYIYTVELLVDTQFEYQLGLAKSLSDSKVYSITLKSTASAPLDYLLLSTPLHILRRLHSANQLKGFGSRVTLLIALPKPVHSVDLRLCDLSCSIWHVPNREFLSEKEIEKELEEEEEERKRNGGVVCHATSTDKFLVLGLELEESQWKTHLSQIRGMCFIQNSRLGSHCESNGLSLEDADCSPEDIKLWLPSSISADCRVSICIEGLLGIKGRLWMAQCNDALQGIWHMLHLKLCMVQFKNKNTWGQQATMRSHSVIDRVHQWALAFATRYRTAWVAKRELIGSGEWEQTLRVLDNKDIRAYTDPECVARGTGRQGTNEDSDEPQKREDIVLQEVDVELEERGIHGGTGEMRQMLSWIWLTSNVKINNGTDKNNEILRSEWCCSSACAKRSQEEVLLLREEMQRVERC